MRLGCQPLPPFYASSWWEHVFVFVTDVPLVPLPPPCSHHSSIVTQRSPSRLVTGKLVNCVHAAVGWSIGRSRQVLPKIMNVAVLLAVHVLIFGVLGYVLFSGITFTNCERQSNTRQECSTFASDCAAPACCSDYFSTLHTSLLQCTWHPGSVRLVLLAGAGCDRPMYG